MCGVVGALAFSGSNFTVTENYITRMREAVAHRGPDGAGTWVSPDGLIGLGHRRLSIIDLSSQASQPMSNADGSLWISFNGEIYNHAELRKELEAGGRYTWKTSHSDTEVILHAFEEWGIACLDRFRGMFAFALWDGSNRQLWLVRDRIGVKPLYYSVHHGRITFASEIKALLEDADQRREINEEALYHYLTFLATPAPATLFAGIQKLAGGTWLRIDQDGRMREQRYWDAWNNTVSLAGVPEDEIAERVLAELRTSVRLRKVSDVPVGVFLSGGIDSSTNAALFSEGERQPVKTFSIGYDEDYASAPNELLYARQMAARVGAEHHEKVLSQADLLSALPQVIRLQDEPIADPVCVPLYYVSALAREHGVTVCQVGEGADELFAGYRNWKYKLQLQQMDAWPLPRWCKRAGEAGLRLGGRQDGFPFELLRRANRGLPIFWGGAEAFTESEKQRLLSPRMRKRLAGFSSWEALAPIRKRFDEGAWEKSPLHWMSYLDLNLRLPELLLMRVDKMGMGAGVEGRVPFLDHRFVELALGIPSALKTKNGVLKYMLKRAVRGVIPDEVINRRKQGFNVPVREWYLGSLGETGRNGIQQFCRETQLLDGTEVLKMKRPTDRWRAWTLLNLSLWWKEFIARDTAPDPDRSPGPVGL